MATDPGPSVVLGPAFYHRPTLDVAAELIGTVLVHDVRGRRAAGMIVEVEAYIGESDPACHAAPGPTPRNAPLYGPGGRAYVYLNYGMHYLVNAVTEAEGSPAAILIRALEPVEGIDLMQRRRQRARAMRGARVDAAQPIPPLDLCRGPGNLTVALGITLAQNCADLTDGALRIEDRGYRPAPVAWSTRIGISVGTERPWRCIVAGHPCVSGRVERASARPAIVSAGGEAAPRRSALRP
ncbi:MAG TPA: DNA-3-methyladenine glycosylase [Vicinamibacterales bacterium]|nr:DNA-3-methyladenine glycosylase [Vicinamibacterales bacterium]